VAGQSTYWQTLGMCANLGDATARQTCQDKAQTAYHFSVDFCQAQFKSRQGVCQRTDGGPYNPVIDPANFTINIDNPYLPFKPGTTLVYAGPTSQGFQRNTTEVTFSTKVIEGVTCVEVHDQVYTNGQLTEDTLDWYAQDKEGNVWYFGEDSEELSNGRVTTLGGTWQAGVNGAKAGIVMEAHPKVGDFYRQEFLLGTAEDTAGVLSMDQSVTVPAGTFDHCLETYEITGLEPGALEHKYYSAGVGNVLTIDLVSGDRFPLVQILKH